MSPKRPPSYSDSMEVRRPRPVRSRSGVPGATTSTVLNVVRELTAEEKRGARIQAKRWCVDNGLTLADADEMISALGAERASS